MIVVSSSTRNFVITGTDHTFGVEYDAGSEVKYFQAPRYVGNNLDLAGSFLRINYRNANGETDSYLIDDVSVDGDNILFSWTLTPKVTRYKGDVKYVLCATGPDLKVAWHTTLGTGKVLEGLEPDISHVEDETADVVAQLIAMVEKQTAAVEAAGTAQIQAIGNAAVDAEAAAVAEIEAKGVNTRNSIPEDYTALSAAVALKAPAIVCEADGTAITLNDSSDMRLQGMRIFGKSTQDGVPSPEAPVEIVSVGQSVVTVAGKNLLNPIGESFTNKGITFTNNGDGSFSVKGTSTGAVGFRLTNLNKSPIYLRGGVTYTQSVVVLRGDKSTAIVVPSVKDNDGGVRYNYLTDNQTKTAEKDYLVYTYTLYFEPGVTVDCTFKVQLEIGNVATLWEKYKTPQTITVSPTLSGIAVASSGDYTDATGQQWICDEVDLERGVYVQRVGSVVFDGSQPWNLYSTTGSTNLRFRNETIVSTVKGVAKSNSSAEMLCSALPVRAADATYLRNDGISLELNKGLSVYYAPHAGDVNAWIAYLSEHPMTVQYVLADPVETPLSETEIAAYRALHTNKPHTTLLNSEGAHMAVEYVADTKLYIDNLIKNQ